MPETVLGHKEGLGGPHKFKKLSSPPSGFPLGNLKIMGYLALRVGYSQLHSSV